MPEHLLPGIKSGRHFFQILDWKGKGKTSAGEGSSLICITAPDAKLQKTFNRNNQDWGTFFHLYPFCTLLPQIDF